MTRAKRKAIDWEAIEREYRLGQKSLRVLTAEFGPAPGTISKRASKEGWIQDKSAEVRQKTKAALLKETLKETETPPGNTKGNTPTREDIDRAVQTNLQAIRQHRSLISRTLALADRLLKTSEDGNETDPKSHGEMFKTISMGLAKVLPLERQALNLDDDTAAQAIQEIVMLFSPSGRERLSKRLKDLN